MITHTFHQSLIRPNLILGCDRDLFFMFALAAFILVVISQNWTAFFVGLFIWFSSLAMLQRMARADPLMRPVYLRHRRYHAYYPPRSTPYRVNTHEYREF